MAERFGDKLGPRLAQLIGQHVLAARRDHAPIEARIRQVATQALIDRAGLEIGQHYAPIIGQLLDGADNIHPEAAAFLTRTASGRHQWQAISGALAITGAGNVISTFLGNELAPSIYGLVSTNPHLKPDIGTIAGLVARGLRDPGLGQFDAAGLGYNEGWWLALLQAAETIPDAATLFDAVNRGLLPVDILGYSLQRAGIPATYAQAIEQLRHAVLSPADAALAVTRSIFTETEGAARAALSGVSADDFAVLIANTGEPLGLEQLLEALRRGFIDTARFETGFRQARYRNEWAGTALQLAYSPMSAADAIEAAVQGHLSIDAAKVKATQNGLEPGDFQALYDTAGEPLSRTELEELLNRGEIDQATLEQGLRESRLKNKYIADAVKLHVRLPEGRQISAFISHGVITKQTGLHWLADLGYAPDTAAAIVAEGTATKLAPHKALTVGEIHQLHTAGVFDDAQAIALLEPMGYDAADAAYLIRSWDLLAGAAITRQAVGVVRSRYVARHYDHQAAVLYLDSLGIAPDARDRYLLTWDIEREATVAVLTEAQIVKAHKDGLISGQDAHDRLTGRGYTDGDALILLGVAPGGEIPA